MHSLLFCGHPRACPPFTAPCTALGAAGRGIPHSAHSDLTLHIDYVIAVEEAEGVELELGRVLLVRMEVDKGVVFDAPTRKGKSRSKG